MTTDEAIFNKFNFRGRRSNLPWYPHKGTRRELAELFGELNFNFGVEVGTRRGDFAKFLCEKNPNLHLICVDPWLAYNKQYVRQDIQDRIYSEAVNKLKDFNVELRREMSIDAVKIFKDRSIDFVYIDGNHLFDFVMMDLIHWVPKVKRQGIVALHDYDCLVGSDVIKAVDAYTHCHAINPWYVTR